MKCMSTAPIHFFYAVYPPFYCVHKFILTRLSSHRRCGADFMKTAKKDCSAAVILSSVIAWKIKKSSSMKMRQKLCGISSINTSADVRQKIF